MIRYVVSALAALALAVGVLLLVRAGVTSIARFFARGAASISRGGQAEKDLKKTVVVIGAESTEAKDAASGVLLVQVNGIKREINAISVAPNTFVEVPGQGFERIAESLRSGPDTVALTVSNLFGVRAKKYVVVGDSAMRKMKEREDFSSLFADAISSNISKPGKEKLLELIGQVNSDNVSVVPLPVEPLSLGTEMYYQPKKDDIDRLVAGWWGVPTRKEERRLRVMVLNGAGVPGIAGDVAGTLIGRGYQVVDSKNADSFNYSKTLIILYHASKREGLALKKILGTGVIMTKDIPQDIADVSIVVGKDYVSKPKRGRRTGG